MELTPRQRAHLKGLAHHLKPVVHLGKDGITDGVLKQIALALEAHELIKVRVAEGSPLDRHEASDQVPGRVGAFLVQNIGKILILYRPHPEQPRISLPWPKEEPAPMVALRLEDARRPTARAPGSLLRSVREGGSAPVLPPRANIDAPKKKPTAPRAAPSNAQQPRARPVPRKKKPVRKVKTRAASRRGPERKR